MKSLVIYYSLEGNTKLIADTIKNELNSDVLELRTKKQYPNKGFKKYLCGGKSVILKEKPKLLNKYIDISIYDKIFIGTPIWAGTYAVPFNKKGKVQKTKALLDHLLMIEQRLHYLRLNTITAYLLCVFIFHISAISPQSCW